MSPISMLIGGQPRAASNGATFERRNPLDHTVATTAPAATVADAEVQKKLRELNIDPRSSTPEQASALLASDIQRWARVIEKAGIPRQ